MAEDLDSVIASVFDGIREDRLCVSATRSLKRRGIDLKSLVEPLCWVVFWDSQSDWGMDRALKTTRLDWRLLKRLPVRIEKFLDECDRLGIPAERVPESLRRRREKLEKEAKSIDASALLSEGILERTPPQTLSEHLGLLKQAIPNAPQRLQSYRDDWKADARRAWDRILEARLRDAELAYLLNATAKALGSKTHYSVDSVKMRRSRRAKPSV